ncbi:MAG: AMP-binding protein [Eubacteriales bacterium]|nr:AMP-binding protein [Eubacteriales bacterium]MDD4286595.1 AMP-binding protein [Eubacteriales bacterium]NLV69264.1 AMP-binding protein [Clostridiales bacterium]
MKKNVTVQYHKVKEITSLRQMLNESCTEFSQRPAFLVKANKGGEYLEVSYAQVKRDVDALGTRLMSLGLTGEKIAVIGENCYQWITAYYAIANGTGIVVPLDKELSKEEIHSFLNIAACKAIFYTDTYQHYLDDFEIPFKFSMNMYFDPSRHVSQVQEKEGEGRRGGAISWEELTTEGAELLQNGDKRYTEAPLDSDELRFLLFTSGTTDSAKGVMLSHRNIATNIMDTCKIAYVTPEDRTLSILPIHHTFESTMGMSLVLYRGASIAFYEGLKYVAKNLAEAQATILIGVPLIFESMHAKIWKQAEKTGKKKALETAIKINRRLRSLGIDMSRKFFKTIYDTFGGKLRMIITGAAGIDPAVSRGYQDMGFTVLQGYGLTETAPLISGSPDFGNTYKKAGSSGLCVASGEMRIDAPDEDGIGEILFQGPNLMLGYYQRPDLTAECIVDGWFHTGDLGFIDREGWLYITGRKKNVIVTKTGKNIYPEEVEIHMNRSKYIQESLVHGVEREDDTIVSAQIMPAYDMIYEEFGNDLSEDDIKALIKNAIADINEKLPIYKRVRDFSIRANDFVRTTTHKIKRHKNI